MVERQLPANRIGHPPPGTTGTDFLGHFINAVGMPGVMIETSHGYPGQSV